MKKLNCWEAMECGREPDGANADEHGVCPAATEERLDGVHGGANAGRACWAVAGTLCRGGAKGTFALGKECFACSFYRQVLDEESPDLMFTPAILGLLNKSSGPCGWAWQPAGAE